jgi:hypothetical protein
MTHWVETCSDTERYKLVFYFIGISTNILSRICGHYIRRVGLTTGFIGSHTVTHNYSVYALQLTTVHYNTCRVLTLYLHSLPVFQYRRIRSPATLQLFSEDCCSARILTRNSNSLLSCQLTNSADSAISFIAGERTPKKTPLRFPYCWMTSLPERTTKKTLVRSIVALLSNGYKQRFHCWLLTYSVHVI